MSHLSQHQPQHQFSAKSLVDTLFREAQRMCLRWISSNQSNQSTLSEGILEQMLYSHTTDIIETVTEEAYKTHLIET